MHTLKLKPHQLGDTIVEVLLCLVIVGLSFSLSYYVARRSLNQVRDSEERQEVIKLVEEQLERLQVNSVSGQAAHAGNDADCLSLHWAGARCFVFKNTIGNKLPSGGGYFCIDASLKITFATDQTDTSCQSSINSLYWVAIYYNPDHNLNPDNDFYAVGAFKSLIGGPSSNGYSVVTDMYRLHP